MVQEIMKDMIFLAQPSDPATPDDLPCAQDLLDTLKAHRESCVGMAANMIGVRRRIIAFNDAGKFAVLFKPEIVRRSDPPTTVPRFDLRVTMVKRFLNGSVVETGASELAAGCRPASSHLFMG